MKKMLWMVVAMCMVPFLALADTVTLDWPVQVEDAAITGFKVYQGQASGAYGVGKDVGKVQTYAASCPQQALMYSCFFVITAYNTAGESGKSNEVSKVIPAAPVVAPTLSLAVVGDPATGPWNVSALSNVVVPFDTEVYVNGIFHHTDTTDPRCVWRNATAVCSGGFAQKAAGSYNVEFRVVKAGVELIRKSVTVVVPLASPTGLTAK